MATARARRLLVALAIVGLLAFPASASALTDYTWNGSSALSGPAGNGNWSNPNNWVGGSAPSGSVGTLTFPVCGSGYFSTPRCYITTNDIAGLSAAGLSVTDAIYDFEGTQPLTIGAKGITSTMGVYELPLVLGADQTWSFSGDFAKILGPVSGANMLAVNLSSGINLDIASDVEVGALTITGGDVSLTNGNDLVHPSAKLNATDGSPVNLTNMAIQAFGTSATGPLTTSETAIQVGDDFTTPNAVNPATLSVNGLLTLGGGSSLAMTIGPGTTPGTDYSQVSASGPVSLSGTFSALGPNGGACPTLNPGDVYTLVTTTAALAGRFANAPDGSTVTLQNCTGTAPTLRINYTANSVTATVLSNTSGGSGGSGGSSGGGSQTGQTGSTGTQRPAVAPRSPSPSGSTAETVSDAVNPQGSSTTAYYEYGSDLSERGPGSSTVLYDQRTPTQTVGSDSSQHTVTALLTGLVPNTTYHVRLVTTNMNGTTLGPDQVFTTPKAPVSAVPPLGQENFTPHGTIYVLLNGRFVKLTQTLQLPSGTVVDALHGSLTLVASSGAGGRASDARARKPKTYTGTFSGAVFKVVQTKRGPNRGLTTISLVDNRPAFPGAPSYATTCRAHRAADGSAVLHPERVSRRVIYTLRSRSRGRWSSRGRYAAGTVGGTVWTTTDRCDGTLITAQVHTVLVNDLVHHIRVLLHPHQHYLARKK